MIHSMLERCVPQVVKHPGRTEPGQEERAREQESSEDWAPWQRWSRAASSRAGRWAGVSHHRVVILHLRRSLNCTLNTVIRSQAYNI